MAVAITLQVIRLNINLIDLPESVFREIFQYLESKTIYISLRHVCKKLKEYSDNFLQLKAVALGAEEQLGIGIWTLQHIFKRASFGFIILKSVLVLNKNNIIVLNKKVDWKHPSEQNMEWFNRNSPFGMILCGKVIVGAYYPYQTSLLKQFAYIGL